jgi:hypothetical protein
MNSTFQFAQTHPSIGKMTVVDENGAIGILRLRFVATAGDTIELWRTTASSKVNLLVCFVIHLLRRVLYNHEIHPERVQRSLLDFSKLRYHHLFNFRSASRQQFRRMGPPHNLSFFLETGRLDWWHQRLIITICLLHPSPRSQFAIENILQDLASLESVHDRRDRLP